MTVYSCVQNIIYQISKPLADYLSRYLPKIGEDWWFTCVIPNLPPHLQQIAQKNNLQSLDTLSLLRIFDRNWDDLRQFAKLDYILRNYIKEAITIRNTWAHPPADGNFSDGLIERHLDTLQRLCESIEAPSDLIATIIRLKSELCAEQSPIPEITQTSVKTGNDSDAEITIGTFICLISNPKMFGPVIEISTTSSEPRYTVFVNNKKQQWYKSQIRCLAPEKTVSAIPLKQFNAILTATQISNPNSQSLFSLNSGKIQIIPHQFRPVLKFIKADRPRLLIADGVGVGKTIEAGLIIKELEARHDIHNILIICPKPLISERKWQDEMKSKFGESFTALDSSLFRQVVMDAQFDEWNMSKYGKVIIPYSILRDNNLKKSKGFIGLFNLPNPPHFDLVIVDEAHHIRNSSTQANAAVQYFVDNADAALFLTATPIQMGDEDLYTLLHILRPDLIPDYQTFKLISEPNSFINQAISEFRRMGDGWRENVETQLDYAVATKWGKLVLATNPTYTSVREQLKQSEFTDEERISLLTDLESLHTFSAILNRTRRRDIDSGYATRKSITIETPFLSNQQTVYNEVVRIQSEILSKIRPNTPAGFMIKTLERRAASCLPALLPFLYSILTKHLVEDDYLESDYDYEDREPLDFVEYMSQIKKLIDLANTLPDVDSKYNALLEILEGKKDYVPNKVMVFSTFRHTLSYLFDKLSDDGYRVGLIYGDIKDEERRYLRQRFQLPMDDPNALDILLFSEVGTEGLDYQFCDCMVNYDLPWNPMKIEQRIGRIDRTGQKSETISIFNLITPQTVDAQIFYRCLARIGVFEDSIGSNEIILGDIAKAIQEIGDNFLLTDSEKDERLSQLADNEIRRYIESQKLADEGGELFGLALPTKQISKEMNDATNFWLSPESLENLLKNFFRLRFNSNGDFILGSGPIKKLRLNAEARMIIQQDSSTYLQKGGYGAWKRWLDGKDREKSPYYAICFDSKTASESDGDLMTPVHPLVRLAVSFFSNGQEAITSLTVHDSSLVPGTYHFAVYLWTFSGVLQNQEIVAVMDYDALKDKVFELLRTGADSDEAGEVEDTVKENLEEKLYALWKDRLADHKKKTHDTIESRINSLNQSYQARIAGLNDVIDSSTSPDIIRMKSDELKNVRLEQNRKLAELKQAEETADIEKSLIGYGIIEVK